MIKEAAQRLLDKGKITKEEYDILKEAAYVNIADEVLASAAKKIEAEKGVFSKIMKYLKPAAFTAAGSIGTAAAGKELVDYFKQKQNINNSYEAMEEKVPMLSEYPEDKIKDYFEVVKTFSPTSAANPLVAGALVHKMLEFGGVDHKLVQDIAKIEDSSPSLFYEIAKSSLGGLAQAPKDH